MRAQSVTSGTIEGVTLSADGRRLMAVDVTFTDHATGRITSATSDAAGAYRAPALAPGRYDILAERLGYRPLFVSDVSVGPAAVVTLDFQLTAAEPPVTEIDTLAFVEGAMHASLARGSWDRGRDLADLVDPAGRVTSVAILSAASVGGLGMAGLPDRLGVVGIDGILRHIAAHPEASRSDVSALDVPLIGLDHAEVTSGADVEWSGSGGGLLSAFTARAPRDAQVRAYADVAGGGFRGGVVAGGPLVRDTASAVFGIDFRRVETRFGAPWRDDSASQAVVAIARDSFAQDLSGYLRPVSQRTDVVTAFGRFDWEIARGQTVALRAALANQTSNDLDLGADRPLGLGTTLQARDINASAALTSRLGARVQLQLSFAVDRSVRDYQAPPLPGTSLTADGLFAGADAGLPGRFERNDARAAAGLLLRTRLHALKAGVAMTWTHHDDSYVPGATGSYAFGGAADFAAGQGSFVQAVGGQTGATFAVGTTAGYLEDQWFPVRGLTVLLGARLEREVWPSSGATLDREWLRLTGTSTAVLPAPHLRLNPRFGFSWAAGAQREWLLRGEAGLYSEGVDPAVLAEVLTTDGGVQVRRGLGSLGAWPAIVDSSAASYSGRALTLLNPGFLAPRTARAALSFARALGGGSTAQLAGQYRHTEFLPRRSDLNLATGGALRDQYGRPVYGTLQQIGSLLAAQPGTDRLFPGYDVVYALDPSGYSDFWGATVSFERTRERGLSVWASYTYSRTTDNWPGGAGSLAGAQLSPFPDSVGASDWRAGRSDLDLPHRAAVGAELAVGQVRIGLVGRYQSGAPFTPGFPAGVDANGDGSSANDPAFVSDTIAGAAALIAGNACLRGQVGRFAQRNSCRAPAIVSLDARLVVRVFTLLGSQAEFVVDALNIASSGEGIVDRALYGVDPARAIATNAATGTVTVPLVVNPDFGKLLVRRSAGATVRAGLRWDF